MALDLDGTLYRGVLGEDGAAGVALTAGHRSLQQYLAELRRGGMLLALVSRNELADVQALFAQRCRLPASLADFSAVEVSWNPKAAALPRVAEQLRIGLDAMVFVDDNPGELAEVAAAHPVVTVHARPDAKETLAAFTHVAGVFRWSGTRADELRADDLQGVRRSALRWPPTAPARKITCAASAFSYLLTSAIRTP